MESEEISKKIQIRDNQIEALKNELKQKNEQLEQVKSSISNLEQKLAKVNELENQLKTKNTLINTLQDSIKLKDNQLETIKDSLKLKDEQIKILETSLSAKDGKIETLEKTIKLKEDQIKTLKVSSADENILNEKDKEIENLRKEIEILNDEITKADEDLERLEIENEKLRESRITTSGSKIVDFTNIKITKSEIIEEMKNILQGALHSVTITVPKIDDLQDLFLYEVRSSVNMKISCEINPGIEEHAELLDEYESLDNISIRNFDGADRYIINRDGEELLLAITGQDENNHLVFKTKDASHIRFLNSMVMESWLRSRKI
jgi:chromosome segregation ATPase